MKDLIMRRKRPKRSELTFRPGVKNPDLLAKLEILGAREWRSANDYFRKLMLVHVDDNEDKLSALGLDLNTFKNPSKTE